MEKRKANVKAYTGAYRGLPGQTTGASLGTAALNARLSSEFGDSTLVFMCSSEMLSS